MSDATEATRHRERLLARIRPHYQITQKTLQFGRLSIPFTRVVDPDVVLDQIAAAEDLQERLSGKRTLSDQLHLPYWAELWDSAFAIGAWLARGWEGVGGLEGGEMGGSEDGKAERKVPTESSLLASSHPLTPPSVHPPTFPSVPANILDLGCGMGLSGTVAAAVGHRVTFADLEPPALLFAALNSAPWHSRVRTRQLNWQTDRIDERFDLILGADILYERKQWDYLEPFWKAHLSPGGKVLLGEPGRQTGELFVGWIRGRNWTLTESQEAVAGREKPIRLFHVALQ